MKSALKVVGLASLLVVALGATAQQVLPISFGTYTPTLTNTTNVAASTAYVCRYVRIGNFVAVSGRVDIDPTSGTATTTLLKMSLPIASNLTAEDQLSGVHGARVEERVGACYADATNDLANFGFVAFLTAQSSHDFVFTYVIQ